MRFLEQAFLVWFQPDQAFRQLRGNELRRAGGVWLAATAPFMLLAAAKASIGAALAAWAAWTGFWLLSACLIHAVALRRFSRPLLGNWLLFSAYAHLPVWVVTPFAAVGPGGFLLALLVGLGWVLCLEGRAVQRLYNRPALFSFGAVLLPRLLPLAAIAFAFGVLVSAVVSFLV